MQKQQVIADASPFSFSRINQSLVGIIKKVLPSGHILELGSGEGGLTYHLLQEGYEVTPTDIDPANFRIAGIECTYLNMHEQLPFQDNQFDCVIFAEVVEHLENHFHIIRECQRVLKKNGILIVTTPNILNLASRMRYFLTGFFTYCTRPNNEYVKIPFIQHINPINYYNLRYIIQTNGMKIHSVTTDRYRKSALWLFFWYPLLYPLTFWTMKGEADERQQKVNKHIAATMLRKELLFGRTLILIAQKI